MRLTSKQKKTAQKKVTKPCCCQGNGREEKVRSKAYELYEQRGRTDGEAWKDWFEAEKKVNQEDRPLALNTN